MTTKNNRTMFGVSPDNGTSVLIRHSDWLFLDLVLASKPEWNNLIETGTFYGLTSLYLGVIAKIRGGQLHTYDNIDQRKKGILEAWPDCISFSREDVLESTNPELVRWLSKPNTFCMLDNGDKAKEANMYMRHLSHGSGVAIHDFGKEVSDWDLGYVVKEYGFASYMDDVAAGLGSSFRCFVRA